MSTNAVSSLLINNRIAVRDQRNANREKIHNERRAGLSVIPSLKQIKEFDETEMTQICKTLRRGRSSNISVPQLRTLKQLLLHQQGMVSFMKDRGLHGLIGVLSGKRPIHQLEAACICVNLGLGEEAHCLTVSKAAGPYLIQFLEGSSYYLQEASAWAIGNLAGASNKCAIIISSQGAVVPLIQLLSGPEKGLSLAAAYALIHILHSKMLIQEDELVKLAEIASSLLSTEPDFCVLLYLLSCFSICEKTLLENGVVKKTIAILTGLVNSIDDTLKTFTALLRTMGNLSSGLGALEIISSQDACQLLQTLLTARYEHLTKETAWICANLMCHESECVRAFANQVGFSQAFENFKTPLLPP